MTTPNATVLVVEDEDSFVEALTVGLKREGFRVQVARDGAEALDVFDAVQPDLVLLDVMLPEGVGHRRVPRAAPPLVRCRSSWSRPRAARSTRSSASRSAPTTTSPSRTGSASWWPACGPCSAAGPPRRAAPRRSSGEALEVGDVALDPERHEVVIRGEPVSAAAQGVRAARAPARQRRPGAAPRDADRPGVGHRLRRRHQDPRRPREAAAGQGRARPVAPHPDRHHPGPRLQVRGAQGLSAAARRRRQRPVRWARCPPRPAGSRFQTPKHRAGADAFHLSPFARLARAHVLVAAGRRPASPSRWPARCSSTSTRTTPAGRSSSTWRSRWPRSPSSPRSSARPSTARIGGRRWMIVAVNAVRAVVCLVMLDDLDSLLLFPEAFAVLAMGKAYGVARSALVPTVVRNDAELVEANSKLQLLSGLAVPARGPPGRARLRDRPAREGVLVRGRGRVRSRPRSPPCASPRTQVAAAPATAAEAAELRGVGIRARRVGHGPGPRHRRLPHLPAAVRPARRTTRGSSGVVLGAHGRGRAASARRWRRALRAVAARGAHAHGAARRLAVVGRLGAAWVGGLGGRACCSPRSWRSCPPRAGSPSTRSCSATRPTPTAAAPSPRFEVRFQLVWVVGARDPAAAAPHPAAGRASWSSPATAGFALFSYLAGQRAAHRDARGPAGPGMPDGARRRIRRSLDHTAIQPEPIVDPDEAPE